MMTETFIKLFILPSDNPYQNAKVRLFIVSSKYILYFCSEYGKQCGKEASFGVA